MGVGMKLKVKALIEEPIATQKRIYFEYDKTEYIVTLVHRIESGYELNWVKEGNTDYPQEPPKWLWSFIEDELKGMSFESWLYDMTEDLNG